MVGAVVCPYHSCTQFQRKTQHGPSSHDLVSHATERNRAEGLFGVKVIWESGIDLARLVECLYLSAESAKSKLARLSCS
jgi:hypothetical protein